MARIGTIADIEALEAVPLAARRLPATTYGWLERGAAAAGADKVALRFFLTGRHYRRSVDQTYGQLLGDIRATANLLHECGVGSGDVVSLLLPNLPETFAVLFGAETVGIANPINPMLEPEVIAEIMNAARAKVLVTLAAIPKAEIWDKAEIVRRRVPTLETVIQVDLARYLPPLQRALVGMLRLGKTKPSAVAGQQLFDLRQALADQPTDRLAFARAVEPGEIASMFHTGGTTGTPKLARHTHANEVFDAWALTEMLDSRPGQVILCGLPLFHVNGVVVTGLAAFGSGQTVVLASPQGYRGEAVLENFWRIVEHYRLSSFSAVPTVYAALSRTPLDQADIRSLEFAGCGAAPMPLALFERFQEQTGVRILEGYGLTEGTCVSSLNPLYGDSRVGSIGLRLPYQQLKAVRLDAQGRYLGDCEPDEVGAIVIRGPNVMPGYCDRDHDRGLWIEAADAGVAWMNTGDLGRLDADGYAWLAGRRKELIIRGGHNIDPALIEEPLARHPAVALAAAVGRPDPIAGEFPVAYVLLRDEMAVEEGELLDYAHAHIGERAAVPKHIRIVDELPLTAVGKVFKPALGRLEIESAVGEAVRTLEGVAAVNVSVRNLAGRGDVACVRLTVVPGASAGDVHAAVAQVLGRYAFASEIEEVGDSGHRTR